MRSSAVYSIIFLFSINLGELWSQGSGGGSPPSAPTITYVYFAPVVFAGSSQVFWVNVSGTPPFTYQWRKDGQELPASPDAHLSLSNLQPSDAGVYTVTVTNSWGSVTSSIYRLTVRPLQPRGLPVITAQPGTYLSGDGFGGYLTLWVSVTATSATPMTYQWYKNGQALPILSGPLGSSNIYPISYGGSFLGVQVPPSAIGDYWVEITNADGSVLSDILRVRSSATLAILESPQGQTVTVGANVTLAVRATGADPLTFAWKRDGVPIVRTGPILTLTNVQPSDAGDYTVTVTDASGSITTSPAKLIVDVPAVSPAITRQPVGTTVMAGARVQFEVAATGTGPLSYQWSRDGVVLAGANAATYTLPAVQATDAGAYSVIVTNRAGSVTSRTATLVVDLPVTVPVILTQPLAQTVRVGERVEFAVVAAGTAPLSYQWRQGSAVIAQASGPTLVLPSVQLTDGGTYEVTVTNGIGFVVSVPARLTVLPPQMGPVLVTPPIGQTARVGADVVFEVVATGSAPLTYVWRRAGVPIAGATGSTLRWTAVRLEDAGDYDVVVSNPFGTITTALTTLVVQPVLQPPVIIENPTARTLSAGARMELRVTATGSEPLSFEWRRNDVLLPAETGPLLVREAVQLSDDGQYQVRVINPAGRVQSDPVRVTVMPPPSSRISNVSVRTTLAAEQRLIVGLTMTGGPKPVLVRAVGPGLIPFGVTDAMPDPGIALFSGSVELAKNDNWGGGAELLSSFASVGAFALPAAGLDAAIVSPVEGGRTLQVSGATGGTVLVEAYDAGAGDSPRLTNVSARNRLKSGSDRLIAGFTISGNAAKTVLVRAAGPTLGTFGVPGVLQDPKIELYAGTLRISDNDHWDAALAPTFDSLGAFRFTQGSKDAALLLTLQPGGYTVQVVGADPEGGEVLVELYEVKTP